MKQHILLSIVATTIIVLIIVFSSCTKTPSGAGKELVIFYDVRLACGAAPDIGCGSRAKPVFIEMEQQEGIKEAWLNRSGTVIAVVGGSAMTDRKQLAAVANPIFKEYEVDATYIEDQKRQSYLMSDFRVEGKWYKGVDVDKLSIEEATALAEKAVKFAREAKLLNELEAQAIQSDIETHFKNELVKVRTYDELCDAEEQWYADVYGIYQKHIGRARAKKVRKFYEEYQSSEDEKE